MTHDTSPIDDVSLDRLVDGELTPAERRELLLAIERHDGWRRCALAFLESQTLAAAAGAFLESRLASPAAAVSRPAEFADVAALATPTNVESKRTSKGGQAQFAPRTAQIEPDPGRRRMLGVLLSSAAAVAAAFGLGWQIRGARTPLGDAPAAPPLAVAPLDGSARDAVTLVVQDEAGQPQRIRIPLVDGSELGGPFAAQPQFAAPPQLRERLQEQGLDLALRRRYAPLFFEQQDRLSPMLVPVDDAVATPVSYTVY